MNAAEAPSSRSPLRLPVWSAIIIVSVDAQRGGTALLRRVCATATRHTMHVRNGLSREGPCLSSIVAKSVHQDREASPAKRLSRRSAAVSSTEEGSPVLKAPPVRAHRWRPVRRYARHQVGSTERRSHLQCSLRSSGRSPRPLKLAFRSRNTALRLFSATTCRKPCSTSARRVVRSRAAICAPRAARIRDIQRRLHRAISLTYDLGGLPSREQPHDPFPQHPRHQ